MKLYAISDLHLANPANRRALEAMPRFPEDWLIVAGDVGETADQLHFALSVLTRRFAQVLWVPGNHDLWTLPTDPQTQRGEARYRMLVAICRNYGVLTPEDPFVRWPGEGPACVLAPVFTLYDYSFRPADVTLERAVDWAAETNVVCSDEVLLYPDPYPSRQEWCAARCVYTERRLMLASEQGPLVLINHYPLREDLFRLRYIPRFSLWCGTKRTENWHTRFAVHTAVYGHLHIRGSQVRDGVRFEEVSLGYPRDWDQSRGVAAYLRQILPALTSSGSA
ncbi:MAG TPA: metallophosphoesterase [Roseiflexaceae bacterium]|nr:metallophosphoesterase [Roseiflexaceae bacterium]